MNVCTIIAKNYIAHARVLASSLLEHDPGAQVWVLIIDDFTGYVDPAQERFEVLTPADIGCEPFTEMAMRYSVLELSTAVKPWLLRHLLAAMGAPVTYLDPDIKVYGSLARLDQQAAQHGVVLIPHNREPIPPDGRKPSQVDIMIAGVYNLGYVSLAAGPEVEHLLDWWGERLVRDCRVDPVWGYFVDQRWFDLAPGFLGDFAIVRDPEYNVAYWNLHSRRLEHDGHCYLVDGRPLAFFHFSGFDPRHPLVLSRHQNRIDVSSTPALERLLAEYAGEVMQAGHEAGRRWPYSFERLGDGTPLDDRIRSLYGDFAQARGGGAPSPFSPEGARDFSAWLRGQARSEEADTGHAASRSGPQEESAPLLEQPWGVNVAGYFRSEVGTGAAARQVVAALDTQEIPVLPIHGQTVPLSRQGHAYHTAAPEDAAYPVNLICMNADMLPEFAGQVGEEFFAARYSIGLWFWEISRFPERWRDSFSLVEEVWAPTSHIAEALEPVATVPVHTVRIPVQVPAQHERARSRLGLADEAFLFLFSFDYLSVFRRKNPVAVVDAFRRAVQSRFSNVRLVLKCVNHERDPEAHAELLAAIDGHPAIDLIDCYLAPEDNIALSGLCDCYISLHRAEGFGLGMAEAMWHGKPVIATGYSGNLDFMSPSNGLLVDYELTPIGGDAEPYPPDAEWAEPDVEHAARLMRQVLDDPHAAAQLGRRAAAEIRRTHSPEAAGEIMYRRLEAIRGTWSPRRAAPRLARDSGRLATLPEQVRQGPPAAARGPGAVRQQLRNTVLRAMRPFTVYQQAINRQLVAALQDLSAGIAQTRRETSAELARVRAELRTSEQLRSVAAQLEEQRGRIKELERRVGSTAVERGRPNER